MPFVGGKILSVKWTVRIFLERTEVPVNDHIVINVNHLDSPRVGNRKKPPSPLPIESAHQKITDKPPFRPIKYPISGIASRLYFLTCVI